MKKQMPFAIGIPTLNRFDLLLPTLMNYAIDMPNTKIFVYDNGLQKIKEKISGIRNVRGLRTVYADLENVVVFGGTGHNIGVAGAWNYLCDVIFNKHDYALILNDDVYFGKEEDNITKAIDYTDSGSPFDLFLPNIEYYWSTFLMPKKTFQKFTFDDNFFPAYYEDVDMERRLSLSGAKVFRLQYMNPALYRNSMTLEKDPNIITKVNDCSKQYYIKKWGGDKGEEKFTKPFGND